MKKNLISAAMVCAALLLLASCAPKKPGFERNNFLVETQRQLPAQDRLVNRPLTVRIFSVSPIYQGKEIIYRTPRNRVHSDFYNHYFVLPGPMITDSVKSWFRDSGLFASVVPVSSHLDTDLVLEGAINALYADYTDQHQPRAVLDISFLVLEFKGVEYEIVFHKQYRKETQLTTREPVQLINGLNKALNHILTLVEEDMAIKLAREEL
ncbi:ABC-type transport auxiliary lipoprotein family protein [Desulfonatronovibrio hydrogenovorans]|uniref:ABC-type transport auxiliary lipoprotein family protein n=1 Tax=Desulfonatronovibrio hydrogenovorans TaxID=53245 RepID=UPI00048A9843|nr:hypothetical protein [Desulfonatronovibrio hydrogenovorans]